MATRVLKPIVAEVNPNLYQAAVRANMPAEQQVQIEQMSWAVKKNKELVGLTPEIAKIEYERLSPSAQEGLKFFYKDAEYAIEPPTFSDKVIGALKFAGKVVASPLISVFKIAGEYNKMINTPYAVFRQVTQGESIFSYDVWDDAWDGRDLYDSKSITEVNKKYGQARTFIAQGLLEGKTPGEIIESYGAMTPDLVSAMEEAFNNPETFQEVLDSTKFAQISPGRDLVRFLMPMPPANGGLSADEFNNTRSKVSGTIDFIYQIAIDPLTWITSGSMKAITRGTQLKNMVIKAGDNPAMGIREVFSQPDVIKLWDVELGPQLKKLSDVSDDAAAYSTQLRFIKRKFPGYNNNEILDFFVRNEMFTAEKAEDVFHQGTNVMKLLSGRVDGMSYARNGVVTSRNNRRVIGGVQSFLENQFDKVYVKADKIINKNPLSTLKGPELFDALKASSKEADEAFNPNLPQFLKEQADIKKFKKTLLEVGRQASRNPSGQAILYGTDTIKTLETFRNYARLILDRDMADYVTRRFQLSPEAEQIVIIRNVYAGILQRAGITDKEIINQYLKKTHGGKAGFASTTKTGVDTAFARVLDPSTVTREGDNMLLEASGALQLSQLSAAIGPLPLEQIKIEANQILSKGSLIQAGKGTLKSKWAKDFVDLWSIFTLYPRLGVRSAIDEGFMYALTAPGKDLLQWARGRGRELGQRSTVYSGSNSAEGPVMAAIRTYVTKKGPLSKEISIAERNNIIERIALEEGVTPTEVNAMLINEAVASRAQQLRKSKQRIFGNNASAAAQEDKYLRQAMIHHADVLESMSSSISGRASLGNAFDSDIRNEMINISGLNVAMREVTAATVRAEVKASGKKMSEDKILKLIEKNMLKAEKNWAEYSAEELSRKNPKYLTLSHFDAFGIRFGSNRQHGKNLLLDGTEQKKSITVTRVGNDVGTKSIPGGNSGKGTPIGDAKDIAMRNDADFAIVELEDINRQKEIISANTKAIGTSSTETSLMQLGPATGNLTGKTIMLARNGKLSGRPLREETIAQIKSAKEAGARFVVGDMPGVDSAYYKILNDIEADYVVYHTNTAPRVKINTKSSKEIKKVTEQKHYVAPAKAFFRHDGLRTPENFEKASTEMLTSVGLIKGADGVWVTTDKSAEAVNKFVNYFAETVNLRAQGMSDARIARIHIEKMLIDLKDNFHGGPKQFNQDLFDLVIRNYQDLVDEEKLIRAGTIGYKGKDPREGGWPDFQMRNKWQTAINRIEFDDFDKATLNHQPTGIVRSRIRFPEFGDFPTAYKQLGDTMMEQMDRQVTGMMRQPALMVTYTRLRSEYAGIESRYYNQLYESSLANEIVLFTERNGYPPTHPDTIRSIEQRVSKRVTEQSERLFTEHAINEATDTVLKFADNPAVRTNFAVSVRTVGRFYRATEDFWRRTYRLKDVSPTVLYRMRLAHLGLGSSGMFHTDQNGEPYIMMPMDNIIFKATDTTIKVLTGNSQYKQPLFDDFTMRLTNVNPSFSPDSGLPLLSGPIAGLAVKGMTAILGNVPIPGFERLSQDIDRYALGQMGDDAAIEQIVVPGSLLKIWRMLPVNEKSRQEVTAAQQAIAYNAANGYSLKPTIDIETGEVIPVSDEEKYKYLKGIRISAHNIIALRSVLGLISPLSPGLQESRDMPGYLLDVGITGLRSEFWDIFEAIQTKYGDDVQDPYEMALSMFTGKNPGKIVYTVSRDDKQTKVLIGKTSQMRNWALNNKKLINTYGEAAYIFGPHTGDFNATVYNWLHASDLIRDKDMETYYDDVAVAEDKQKYFNVARWENEELGKQQFISERKKIIETATAARQGLLTNNPLLLKAITGGGNEIATEQIMMSSLKQMISNPDTPIEEGLKMKMSTAIQAVEDFVAFSTDERTRALQNASSLKLQYRRRVENILSDLASEDPAIKEAVRAIFNSILNYYSRDSYKAEV
jgi:hypothetical protein